MNILAIDPGIEKVGYAVFEKKGNEKTAITYITSGLIKTAKTLQQSERLKQIYGKLKEVIENKSVDDIVMEQLFFFKNAKTVISVAQAQGVIELLSADQNVSLTYLTPLQIKETITGYGRADKKAVQKMIDLTLQKDITVLDDDQSDAIACGLAYCYLITS